jgi:hypothetical protein
MDPERVSIQKKERNYSEKSDVRGGGESGSYDRKKAVGAKLVGAAKARAGSQMAAESGRTKITAVVTEGLLSWPQVIEQLTMPLLP